MTFAGGSNGKESAYNARGPGSSPRSGRPLEKGMATLSLILLLMPVVLLSSLSALFTEPRAGKVRAERLERDSRCPRNCRYGYSRLFDQQPQQ